MAAMRSRLYIEHLGTKKSGASAQLGAGALLLEGILTGLAISEISKSVP